MRRTLTSRDTHHWTDNSATRSYRRTKRWSTCRRRHGWWTVLGGILEVIVYLRTVSVLQGSTMWRERCEVFPCSMGTPRTWNKRWSGAVRSDVLGVVGIGSRGLGNSVYLLVVSDTWISDSTMDVDRSVLSFEFSVFLIFWARKSPLDMGSWLVLKKISSNNIKYGKLCEELMYWGICWNNHFFVGFSTCQTLQTERSRSFDPFDLLFFFPCR